MEEIVLLRALHYIKVDLLPIVKRKIIKTIVSNINF